MNRPHATQHPTEPNPLLSPASVHVDAHSSPALAVGIDVGGTKIAGGVVDLARGTVHARMEQPTAAQRGGQKVLADVMAMARALQTEIAHSHDPSDCLGIGVGICELVDPQGEVQSAHTVAWQGLPVQAHLEKLAPLGVVESDVRAHALAEAYFGAGAEFDLFVFVTVGTGISSTLVQDRVPLAGAKGNALVLASFPLEIPLERLDTRQPATVRDGDGPLFSHFVLEEYAAGPALLARYHAATGTELAHGRELFARVDQGDPVARQIVESGGAALGNSLAFLVNVVDPQAVVLGGGLGVAGGLYAEAMENALRRAIYAENTRDLPILPARLGNDAGIVGAALAVQNRARRVGSHRESAGAIQRTEGTDRGQQ